MKFELLIKDAASEDIMKVMSLFGGIQIPLAINTPDQSEALQENESTDETSNESVEGILDKNGLPWDARIHSGNKKMTAKGVWTRLRGLSLDPAQVIAIENEIRNKAMQQKTVPVFANAHSGGAMPIYEQPVPPVITQDAPLPIQSFPPVIPATLQQQPAPVVTAPMPLPPAQEEETVTFEGFMQKFQSLFNQGLVTPDYLTYLAQKCGAAAITDLAARPDLIKYAISVMKLEGKW